MNLNDFINQNYYDLLSITKKITKNHELTKDLLHEVIIQLLEKEKITIDDPKNLKYFFVKAISLNWNSKNSPFYYKYKKKLIQNVEFCDEHCNVEDVSYDFEKELIITKMEETIAELDWFHRQILQQYMILGSMKKVKNLTKIPITSISRYVNEGKNVIKDNLKKM